MSGNDGYVWDSVKPNEMRHLRACMICAIVQTYNEFLRKGCPNCHPTIDYKGSMDTVTECTSQMFEGVIAIADPSKSWIAKWLRLDNYVRGMYATKVIGMPGMEVIDLLNSQDIEYIPRDGSENNME